MKDFFNTKYIPKAAQSQCLYDNLKTSKRMLLSFAVPTYNRAGLLLESIRSILTSCSKAGFNDFELVVVDNGEDASSYEFLKKNLDLDALKNRFRYFQNSQNLGMFGNWNRCLELAASPWISILNDDDLFCENAMEVLLKHFNNGEDLFLLQNRLLNEKDRSKKSQIISFLKTFKLTKVHIMSLDDYYWGMPSMGSLGVIFKREIAFKIGGFPEEFFPINDWVFFSKYMNETKRGIKINIPSTLYRMGFNESMKPEVAKKSLELSYEFRLYLGKKLDRTMNDLYSKMFVLIRIHAYKRLWSIETDTKELSKTFSLKWYHFVMYPFFRYAIFFKKLI